MNFLAPHLPFLIKAGKSASEKLAENTGEALAEDGLEAARSIWKRLLPAADKKPATIEAAQDVAAEPESDDARAALRLQLRKLLAEDEALALDLVKLIADARPPATYHAELHGSGAITQGPRATAAGARGVAIGGDASDNVIVTGDDAAVEQTGKDRG